MANREDLSFLRSARAGQAHAQLTLGRRYLFGGAGLPKSADAGLYWLECAARQGEADAWMLIGTHVPFETAVRTSDRTALYVWYGRAFDEGVIQAGLVLAKLVLAAQDGPHDEALRRKAWQALERAAESGIPEAQWLLAQELENKEEDAPELVGLFRRDAVPRQGHEPPYLGWAGRAANNGILPAQRRMARHAWNMADNALFLHWALPIAHMLANGVSGNGSLHHELDDADTLLLSRCAQTLFRTGDFTGNTVEKFAEPAARAGDKEAQLFLGLWFAKMDETGKRLDGIVPLINYRKAIQWLTLAARQGSADAWYVISRIYLKAEFTNRSIDEAECYLEYAAQAGHCAAQLELGKRIWRKRRSENSNDVAAAFWLQKACAQGCIEAVQLLRKIATPAVVATWARDAQSRLLPSTNPLLVSRIKLAACFGLSEREALMLDLEAADRGHCLVVDIRAQHVRSKRRLILIQTGRERQTLDHIKRVFDRVDCGVNGPEGNYRQRLYRLNAYLGNIH